MSLKMNNCYEISKEYFIDFMEQVDDEDGDDNRNCEDDMKVLSGEEIKFLKRCYIFSFLWVFLHCKKVSERKWQQCVVCSRDLMDTS